MSQSVTPRVGTENRPDFFCGALWCMFNGVNHQKELSMFYLRLLVNTPSVTRRKVTQLPLSSCWSYNILLPSCTPWHCFYWGDPQDAAVNVWVEISLTFSLRILLFLSVLRLLTVFLGCVELEIFTPWLPCSSQGTSPLLCWWKWRHRGVADVAVGLPLRWITSFLNTLEFWILWFLITRSLQAQFTSLCSGLYSVHRCPRGLCRALVPFCAEDSQAFFWAWVLSGTMFTIQVAIFSVRSSDLQWLDHKLQLSLPLPNVPSPFTQRTLLPTIWCLAGRHLSGDKYPCPYFCVGHWVHLNWSVTLGGTLDRKLCWDTPAKACAMVTPWSVSISWLGNPKLLSLSTEDALICLEGSYHDS